MMLMPFTIMCRGSGLSGLNVLLLRLPRANFSNSSVRAMPSTCLTWLKIRQKSCKSWRLEVPERWRISFLHLNCARIKMKLAAIKSVESESRPRLEIYLLTAFFFFFCSLLAIWEQVAFTHACHDSIWVYGVTCPSVSRLRLTCKQIEIPDKH